MMRSEFEKLFKAQRSYRNSDKEAFIRGCEAAWNHQQSKVDELQVLYTQQGVNMLKLQKRVDAVKQLIKDYKDPSITSDKSFQHGLLLVANELEQALKGGG